MGGEEREGLLKKRSVGEEGRVGRVETYEELLGGRETCPTCRGEGSIPRSGGLIALIPFDDARLRPSRTWLWVLLLLLVCLAIAGLATFFFIPRTLQLSSLQLPIRNITRVSYVQGKHLRLRFANRLNVSNDNYFFVRAESGSASIVNRWQPSNHRVIGEGRIGAGLTVGPRVADEELELACEVELDGSALTYCESGLLSAPLFVTLQFHFTVRFTYLLHSEEDTLTTFQYLCCAPSARCQ